MALIFRCPINSDLKQRHDKLFFEHVESRSCYGGYKELKVFLQKYCKASDRILTTGCTSTCTRESPLVEELYDAGFDSVVGVDNSESNICTAKERNKEKRPEIEFIVGHCLKVRAA